MLKLMFHKILFDNCEIFNVTFTLLEKALILWDFLITLIFKDNEEYSFRTTQT